MQRAPATKVGEENLEIYKINNNITSTKSTSDHNKNIYLHFNYHPKDPKSGKVQRLWNKFVYEPEGEERLDQVENLDGVKIGIER